ncbi:MAG: response regulator, partial [candidate division Zixibacteria bacterium]|nr:response regulator [candidate division Zixibacteria bacterium]
DDLSEYLTNRGYVVDAVSDAATAVSSVTDAEYNVLLLDHMLPDNTGLDILPDLLATCPKLSVIVMTGYPTVDMIISAVRRGACDVVVKPFELKELSQAVERALARNHRLIEGIVDGGDAMTDDHAAGPSADVYNRPKARSTANS